MPLDPSQIIRPSTGVSSNIASGGAVLSDALPYLEFGGRVVGQPQGLRMGGSAITQGPLISLKSPEESQKIYGNQVRSVVDSIISQKRGEGYSQQSSTRLIKDLGGGTQSIIDIDPSTGNTASTLYNSQQNSSRSGSSGSSSMSGMDKALAALSTKMTPTGKDYLLNAISSQTNPKTSTGGGIDYMNSKTGTIVSRGSGSILKDSSFNRRLIKNNNINNILRRGKIKW